MSITSFMYTGVSGMRAHSDAMGIVSDNIANVNTVGYKSSRANFADVLGGTMRGERIGAGSHIGSVQNIFTEGSLLGTGNATDLALRGDGYFVVSDSRSGQGTNMFTRAGQFILDDEGFMVNQQGLRVQGYLPDQTGAIRSTLDDLAIDTGTLPPTATTNVEIDANLDIGRPADPAMIFDPANPDDTSHWPTSVTVYDSVGQSHQLELFFTRTNDAPTEWEVNVTTASADLTPTPAGDRALLATGTLTFGTDGSLTSNSLGTITANWAGAEPGQIDLDLGSPTAAGGSGVDGMTSYAGDSAVSFVSQDGNDSGELGDIQIGDDGVITGIYTNGDNRALGRLAVARFTADNGLVRAGGGLYAATPDSGEALLGGAGTGGAASVVSGSLEGSNVDLASEFVSMISIQRGFQGNSRSITTADEMLTEVVSLKR